jgi:hypothetical protein
MNQASNDYAHDFDFSFQTLNQRARADKAKVARAKFKPDSTTMSRLQNVINAPDFLGRLLDGIENPASKDAKAVLHRILPLIYIAGQHIPFGEAGASNTAFASMLNLHRFFSNYSFFVSFNPVMQDYPLALRIAQPIANNWDDIHGINFIVSASSMERRSILEGHPIGASYTYIRMYKAIFEHLIGFPQSDIGGRLKTRTLPPQHRESRRGCYGPVSAYFFAQEMSKALVQHFHALLLSPINWQFLRSLNINDPAVNIRIGAYFESIIANSLPYDLDNPGEWLPITKTPWNSDPNFLIPATPADPTDPNYDIQWNYIASHKQDHFDHNHSCWVFKPKVQKELTTCRFAMTFHSWNQQSGLYELIVVSTDIPKQTKTVRVLLKPRETGVTEVFKIIADARILVPVLCRPSRQDAPIRTMAEMYQMAEANGPATDVASQLHPDIDLPSRNGYFTDCSKTLTMATYGGQNNVQVTDDSLGSLTYVGNYIKKSTNLQLNSILPLLVDAIRVSEQRPSTREDNANPDVVAQRLLNRMVNNQARHFEVSSRLAISKHLGMPQFESSHTYAYIFTWGAVYNIQKQQKVTFTEAAESQNGLSLE